MSDQFPKPHSFPQNQERLALIAVLATFVALGALYSVVTPVFEASDELWHYPVVQYIASGKGLPLQTDPAHAGPWKQEASQAPLYYAITGLLTSWIDASDMPQARQPNLYAAVGVVTPDGNTNMVVHDPARESWPWHGTVLAVHLARLLSVLMSAATVYLTYRLGREAFPTRPEIALGAAALNAFTPMFVFISGSINNDNLVTPLCGLALLIMIAQVRQATGDERRLLWGWLGLGAVIALATLSKASALALLLPAALSGALAAWQRPGSVIKRWQSLILAGVAIAVPLVGLAGWWFARNVILYGDPLGFKLFTPYFTRAIPADLAQIWSERESFLYGYWGNLGGLSLPIPKPIYAGLNLLLIVSAVSGLAWLIGQGVRWGRGRLHRTDLVPTLSRRWPAILVGLWGVVVLAAWLQWTRTTWSSQGRLVFYAISAYSILMAAGLAAWLPRRAAAWVLGAVGAGMAIVSAAMPFTIIAPAFARPAPLTSAQIAAIPYRADVTFGGAITLLGASAPAASAPLQPGDTITLTLYWQANRALDREYAVFVHLLDEDEVERQDKGPSLPGRGNLPATTLQPGQTWAETWVIPIQSAAYAPARLTWEVGVCASPCDAAAPRLRAVDRSGRDVGDNVRFGQVDLVRPAGSQFNPASVNLGDQIELIGFDLDRRAARPGETIALTLAWRALKPPTRDYTVFAHILQPPQTLWAGRDQPPSPPTSRWQPGQVVTDSLPLQIKPDALPGVYDIEIGVYFFAGDAGLERLKVLTRDGRQQQDFALLSKVRVLP